MPERRLKMPKDEARQKLKEQLEKGRDLENLDIQTVEDLEVYNNRRLRFTKYNEQLLARMFDDDSIHFWKYSIGSTYPDDTPEEKLSFLKSLNAEQLNDLQAIEESLDVLQEFRSDAVVAPGANSKERSELKFPEKVTLAWLWHNVPYSFWISVCTGMFAAFSIGVTIGQTTLAQEWFGKKSISPPLIQPALSNEEVKSKLDQLIQGHNVRRQKLTEAIINEQHDASLFSTGYQERQKAIVDLHKDLENEDATYQSDVKALVDNSLKSNK